MRQLSGANMKVFNLTIVASTLALFGAFDASAAEVAASPKNRTIGYVLTNDHWAIYTTENGKQECPHGSNDGPREQYSILFPDDGTKRSVIETDLAREAEIWFPTLTPDQFVFKESVAKVVKGINLDGRIGPNDYTSPDGEKGIDNEFNRAMGCVDSFRPGNSLYGLFNHYLQAWSWTRIVIELTDVDSLIDDDDVTVTLYKARDPMLTDGSGNEYLPYGTQRLDTRWGKSLTRRMQGKITKGMLTTRPQDVGIPLNYNHGDFGIVLMRGAQLKLNVLPDQANGLWGGYVDVESFYRSQNGAISTHSQSYGRQAAASVYRALYKRADGYPDPKTGRNRAISAAKDVTFKQVYILHSDPPRNPREVASK